jgi:hypothetical protein
LMCERSTEASFVAVRMATGGGYRPSGGMEDL